MDGTTIGVGRGTKPAAATVAKRSGNALRHLASVGSTVSKTIARDDGPLVRPHARCSATHAIASMSSPVSYLSLALLALHICAPSLLQRPSKLAEQLQRAAVPSAGAHKTQVVELLNIGDYTSQTDCYVDIDKPIFQPFPPCVDFAGFAPFEPATARLLFRNNDRFARRMKVIAPDSPFFRVEGPFSTKGATLVDSRAAPGTEIVYVVTFTPRSTDDCAYDLLCVTEREKFVVPLRAHGKRGVLTLPDSVTFPSMPVKGRPVTRTFVVRNVGERATEFALQAPHPYTVAPTKAVVDVGQSVPVVVTFSAPTTGDFTRELRVRYTDTGGAECFVQLVGAGHDVEASLDTAEVLLPHTYVTLHSRATVALSNDSDTPLDFALCRFASAEEDDAHRRVQLEAAEAAYEREVRVCAEWPPPTTLAAP